MTRGLATRGLLMNASEIRAVGAAPHAVSKTSKGLQCDEPHPKCDLFDARDLEPLALFERLDEARSLQHRLGSPSIEPRDASTQALDVKPAALEVSPIHVGDLELS